jgi:hypothetical protein
MITRPDFHIGIQEIRGLLRPNYTVQDIDSLIDLLGRHHTLELQRTPMGGNPALTLVTGESGIYQPGMCLKAAREDLLDCWPRDLVMQAIAERIAAGDPKLAAACRLGRDQWKHGIWYMLKHYHLFRNLFADILKPEGDARVENQANFPSARLDAFDPRKRRVWGHKQNDAYAFVLWFIMTRINAGDVNGLYDSLLHPYAGSYIALLHHLWRKSNVHTDEDMGAWEDRPAVHGSSIASVAVAQLQLRRYIERNPVLHPDGKLLWENDGTPFHVELAEVIRIGDNCVGTVQQLGTNECVLPFVRTADLAQLNPLLLDALGDEQVFSDEYVDGIVANIKAHLMGDHGFARYVTPDVDTWNGRTNMVEFAQNNTPMQWAHGNPTLCVIKGRRYLRTKNPADLADAITWFNRSLGSVTRWWKPEEVPPWGMGDQASDVWYFPEGYCRNSQTGAWAPDENYMLAWGQSMLVTALHTMKQCAALKAELDAAQAPKS